MRGFGTDSESERFRRPKAISVKRTVAAAPMLVAAGLAVVLALAIWLIA